MKKQCGHILFSSLGRETDNTTCMAVATSRLGALLGNRNFTIKLKEDSKIWKVLCCLRITTKEDTGSVAAVNMDDHGSVGRPITNISNGLADMATKF